MIGVKYVSAAKNPSGYGEAARQYIAALFTAGVNVTCETISQMSEEADYGINGAIEKQLRNRDIDYTVAIIHLTPDLIPKYQEKGIYTIAHVFWETDRLPKEWINPLNTIQEIWTASEQMVDMIKKSGITTPCYTFPQPIDVTKAYETIIPYQLSAPKGFIFYSIFQWIDRKNPRTLLRAYWQEFSGNDDVNLLLKTYRIIYNEQELEIIKNDITKWKQELGLKHYPRLLLCHKLMSEKEIWRLHQTGDVFVNPSSGEGWNRPMQEAMVLGKPCISGDNGGMTDVIPKGYYFQVKSHETQATTQSWIPWYTQDMKWKDLDEDDLRIQMRKAYITAKYTGTMPQKYQIDNFSYQKIGQQMKKRLELI